MQNRAGGVDVPSRVGGAVQIRLLGGHVKQRSHRWRLIAGQPGLAKIRQSRFVIAGDQDVGWFDVAVQHAAAVAMVQPRANPAKHLDRRGDRQPSTAGESAFERPALDPLHHVVRRGGFPADFEHLDDVPVGGQLDEVLDLMAQQRPVHAAAVQVEFHRDVAAGVQIAADPDLAKRPGSDEPSQPHPGHLAGRDRRGQRQLPRRGAGGGVLDEGVGHGKEINAKTPRRRDAKVPTGFEVFFAPPRLGVFALYFLRFGPLDV